MNDKNVSYRITLPGLWQNEENPKDMLNICVDFDDSGVDIDLSKSENELLISSSHKGYIHFSYDGGPLTHNSSITGLQMDIDIKEDITFQFYTGPHSNLMTYKKMID